MTAAVLGLDLGTSACKACLLSTDGGVVGEARAEYQTHAPAPLWAEQDPEDWLHAVTTVIRQVLGAHPSIRVAGLALTSAAHIGVLLDAEGIPVRHAILWNDQRATREVSELEAAAGADIYHLSYQAVSTSWTLPHLCWIRRHDPAAWARTRTLLLSKDYLAYWLTGARQTDLATALSAQLVDAAAGAWSPVLCEIAGITLEMLPAIVPATAVVGGVRPEIAALLGLPAGLPVVAGSLDSATELLAAGVVMPGQVLVRLATAGGVQVVVDAPVPHRQRITYPHLAIPYWYAQAGTNTCTTAVRWGMRLLTGSDRMDFVAWDQLAADVPAGAEGVRFHPYLAGERAPYWDASLRGSFTGLAVHHGRGHLVRAIYEGIAFSIRDAMSILPLGSIGTAPFMVTGGGTRSALWLRILAGVLGHPLQCMPGVDSALGAAWVGCTSLGFARPATPPLAHSTLVMPAADEAARYDETFLLYQREVMNAPHAPA